MVCNEYEKVDLLRLLAPTIALLCIVVGKDCMSVVKGSDFGPNNEGVEEIEDLRSTEKAEISNVLINNGEISFIRLNDEAGLSEAEGGVKGFESKIISEQNNVNIDMIDPFAPRTVDEALENYGIVPMNTN